MAYLKYNNIGIAAIAAAVPSNVIKNFKYTEHFPADQARQVVEKIGVYERRFADPDICSSDLCYAAAEKLLNDNDIDRNTVDLLVFISQTPDYRMPATSIILQDRLKLSTSTIAFDISLGCSGFIYGLAIIYAMMERTGLRKALLLDGETRSRIYSLKDRQAAFLFGDAGAAALITRSDSFGPSFFSLNSDGSKEDLIKIKAGGYRFPTTHETMIERVVDEKGNIRSDEHGYLKGSEVFTFVIKEIPSDIRKLIEYSGIDKSKIDYYILHQANLFINSHLIKKLKLEPNQVPSTISKYGNTSSVSIPLTMVSELQGHMDNKLMLLSGFGVGMTWASCIVSTDHCSVSDLVEV